MVGESWLWCPTRTKHTGALTLPRLTGQKWPCHSPISHPQSATTQREWDHCNTEPLEVPEPKTNRIWVKSEALGESAWMPSRWILCPAASVCSSQTLPCPCALCFSIFLTPVVPSFCSFSFPAISHHPWTNPAPISLWVLSNPHWSSQKDLAPTRTPLLTAHTFPTTPTCPCHTKPRAEHGLAAGGGDRKDQGAGRIPTVSNFLRQKRIYHP